MFTPSQSIMTAKATTGVGTYIPCASYDYAILTLASASSYNGTCKIAGSTADAQPDVTATASASNVWGYLDTTDLADAASVDGATGYASAGTDIVKQIRVDLRGINWLNVHQTARSAGSMTANVKFYNQD